jgi:nitrile hydratase accessory protein
MAVDSAIHELTGAAAVPRRNGELVFDAPWQSRAFGMAVGLHQKGLFRWEEFRERLIAEIAAHPDLEGDRPASPATLYYRQWLAALETLLHDKGLLPRDVIGARAREFSSGERDEVS